VVRDIAAREFLGGVSDDRATPTRDNDGAATELSRLADELTRSAPTQSHQSDPLWVFALDTNFLIANVVPVRS
jgi:hypothetical protein